MRLPTIPSEKVRRELIVTSIFACRMGFAPSDVKVGPAHPDEERPDAIILREGVEKTLELTMADPVGSGSLPTAWSKDSILNGGVRGAHDRLLSTFLARCPADRPLSVDVHFRERSHQNGNRYVTLPKGNEIDRFVDELVALSSQVISGAHGPLRPSWRSRDGMKLYNLDEYELLSRYARSVELTEPPLRHPGMIATSLNAFWSVNANIASILDNKAAKKAHADWIIVFEWDIPGVLPDQKDLPALKILPFERVFVLHPASPRWIFEWSVTNQKWSAPSEYVYVAQQQEEAFVQDVLTKWLAAQ